MTKTADEVIHRHLSENDFKPGVYEHWKGGLYHALALGWANESQVDTPTLLASLAPLTRERVVIYLSMTTGEWNTRPYNSDYKDAWNDSVHYERQWMSRFRYVGPRPVPT